MKFQISGLQEHVQRVEVDCERRCSKLEQELAQRDERALELRDENSYLEQLLRDQKVEMERLESLRSESGPPVVQPKPNIGVNLDQVKLEFSKENFDVLLHTIDRSKRSYDALYSKYRKEKEIWKQWIKHFQKEQELPTKDGVLTREIKTPVRAKRLQHHNSELHTRSKSNDLPHLSSEAEGDPEVLQPIEVNCADTSSQQAFLVLSSTQDASSLDLDEVTVLGHDRMSHAHTHVESVSGCNSEHATPSLERSGNRCLSESSFVPVSGQHEAKGRAKRASEPVVSSKSDLRHNNSEAPPASVSRARDPVTEPLGRTKSNLTGGSVTVKRRAEDNFNNLCNVTLRDQKARRLRHAAGCKCCSKFYSMAGPSDVSSGPLWRSPSPEALQSRKSAATTIQRVGRHRSNWRRSPTPPAFWDSGFPTTQEVALEKRQNELRRRRKAEQANT